jgi:lipopolysaccharide/colanic/teichoic acid biosynthesis glycosyltransferase
MGLSWILKSRQALATYTREYLISGFILAFLATTLIVCTWVRRARSARYKVIHRLNLVFKRAIDVIVSIIGLLLSAPIFLVLSVIIKLDSPGPVFFRQVRVGVNRRKNDRRRAGVTVTADRCGINRRRDDQHGRPFEIIKFRTMVCGAEKKCGPVWATPNDPRITRVGAFLRRIRLDEIPQFINILKGEMSLVGPRPERPYFVEKLADRVPGFLDRLQMTPGVTGLAQVRNGYDTSVDAVHQKVKYDLAYISDWNLLKDLKVLCATIIVVITGRGAY